MIKHEDMVQPYDVDAVRAEFPALHQDVRGHKLAYLDNAATTQKPLAVLDAMARYYEADNANVHRGVHALSERATAAYEGARDTLQRFIGAGSRKEVVFTRGTTEAINLVAASFVRPRLEAGDEVLITRLEHHSNIVPWQMACAERGAKLRVAPLRDDGSVDLDQFQELLGPRTKFTSVAHVSNALGTVNPVREMVDAAHAAGSPILLDGAQAAPHLAVDVAALDCDFYTVSAHKMYGPTGIGLLYGKQEHLDAMPPYQGGGDMIRSVTFEGTTYNDLPYKFEAGTPNIAGTIGFAAAADYLTGLGMDTVAAHEHALLEHATDVVGGLDGVRVIGTAPGKAAVLSFVLDNVHPHDVGTLVDQEGIAIRTGHHCAQPVMAHFGVPATCRASMGLYNTREEIDRLASAIGKVQEMFA